MWRKWEPLFGSNIVKDLLAEEEFALSHSAALQFYSFPLQYRDEASASTDAVPAFYNARHFSSLAFLYC